MGKPAFIFTDYHASATVTATDTLTGTDADNILLATEDTVWSPADATGTKDIVIDLFSAFSYDSLAFLGEELNGLAFHVVTSTDNFATDNDYGANTDFITNGTFATSSDWVFNGAWTYDSVNKYADILRSAGDTDEDLQQLAILTSGRSYIVQFDLIDSDSGIPVGTYTPKLGTQLGTGRTAQGTYTETITANGTDFAINGFLPGGGVAGGMGIDNVSVWDESSFELVATSNAAIASLAASSTDRYLKLVIQNPSTSLQIAHIAPDFLVGQPWLEDDWGTEGVQSEFKNLISVDGYYLGTTQTKTMRDININFGEITDTEYTVQVEPWVTSRIKTSSAFFFIPDVDDVTEIYFCWVVDGQGFKAPLKQGVRMAEAIQCLTRLA